MECVPQHRMVIGSLVIPMKPQKKIVKLVTNPRVWKLKDEETHEMPARNEDVTKAYDTQKKWLRTKASWLILVCGGMPNERYVTKLGRNLNQLKINVL